jgi:CDP-glucose 4,6-dehydratase
MLNLVIDKAHHQLGWSPRWDFTTTVERTVGWYRQVEEGQAPALACCLADMEVFEQVNVGIPLVQLEQAPTSDPGTCT